MREKLTNAVATAALKCGYSFFCGSENRMSCDMDAVPAAWLLPVEVSQVDGKDQGVVSYEIELRLVELDNKYSNEQKESLYSKMETHAMQIYRLLCEDEAVQAVTSVSWSPSEYCYTQQAELSLDIEMKIEMVFDRKKFS